MEWGPQQADALSKIGAWYATYKQTRQQVFRVFGYAGTGKTTLAKYIAAGVNGRVQFGTFTGKAALVLRKKGCLNAATLHSLIYRADRNPLTGMLTFTWNEESVLRDAALIIVDEVSMVDDELGADLLRFRRPVLVLGDPAQLPPIRGQGFFINSHPNVLLTEIHRQAADNPIIRMSMHVREGNPLYLGDWGDSRVIRNAESSDDLMLRHDQVIVGRNLTRRALNTRYRVLRGIESQWPVADDRLICLRNDREQGLLNGGMWVAKAVSKGDLKEENWYLMNLESQDEEKYAKVSVLKHFFDYTEDTLPYFVRRDSDEFTYGYAITAHKSQGSEWPSVLIYNESHVFGDAWNRWLYTAITRGAERVTIIQ